MHSHATEQTKIFIPSRQMVTKNHIETVFFDAVGTLIFPAETVGRTYSRFAAGYGIDIGEEETGAEFRRQLASRPPPIYPGGAGSEDLDRAWWENLVFSVISSAHAAPIPGLEFAPLLSEIFDYYATAGAWRVYPEAPRVLQDLKNASLRLAIVSNFDARLRPVLSARDLDRFFSAIVISSEVGALKPSPRIFSRALAATGTRAGQALHVGDCPKADGEGARASGIEPFIVTRPETDLTGLLDHPRLPRASNF